MTKTLFAWSMGIAGCLVLSMGAEALLKALHIPTFLHISFLDSEGEIRDGTFTEVGAVVHILSIMLAVRIGEAIYTGRIAARYDRTANVDFLIWLGCIFVYGVGSAILYFIFGHNQSSIASALQMAISLAMIAGLYFLGKKCRERLRTQPLPPQKPWETDPDYEGLSQYAEAVRRGGEARRAKEAQKTDKS